MSETIQKPAEQKPAFTVLGTIGYNTPIELDNFKNSLDEKGGVFVLIQAANYAQARGAFNLEEAALILAAIRKFVVPPVPDENQTEQPTT